jgi:hypothetical protein
MPFDRGFVSFGEVIGSENKVGVWFLKEEEVNAYMHWKRSFLGGERIISMTAISLMNSSLQPVSFREGGKSIVYRLRLAFLKKQTVSTL